MGSFSTAVFRSGKPASRHKSGVMLSVGVPAYECRVFVRVGVFVLACVGWGRGGGGEPAIELVCFSLAVSAWTCLLPIFFLLCVLLRFTVRLSEAVFFIYLFMRLACWFLFCFFADLSSGKNTSFFYSSANSE